MQLNIPIQVLYAGLAGTVLALLVAMIQNKWSLKVFFLLALRLAIGWHFLFEGLHKIHSHSVGAVELNRPFSSEPYFKEADGPLGPMVRKRAGDIDAQLAARLLPRNLPDDWSGLSPNARALKGSTAIPADKVKAFVPEAVERDWTAFATKFTEKFKLDDAQQKALGLYTDGALAAYGRWVVGIEGRDSTVKFVTTGKPALTAPQRLEYIAQRQKDVDALLAGTEPGLGTAIGTDLSRNMTRTKEAKQLVSAAKAALLTDADALLNDYMKAAFDTIVALKLESAPAPSKFADKDDAKLNALLPAGKSDKADFDALPADVKKLWTDFQSTFKAAYPIDEATAKTADELAAISKERLARWMSDQDEFTGKPKPGLSPLVKAYRDSSARAGSVTANVTQALADMDGTWDASWLTRASYQGVKAMGDKALADADAARKALLAAFDTKFADLKKHLLMPVPSDIAEGKFTSPAAKPTESMDRLTRWTLAAVGAMLLAGLFTRLACLVAVGFLVMTYLTHPPVPWLPLPPGTEGNPLFINKNVIEALALMVVCVHPTGRWMGVDSFLHRVLFPNHPDYLVPRESIDKMPPKLA